MTDSVAFLGLGTMGSAMAQSIAQAGFPLALWNRTQSVAEALGARIGARVATTPAEAVHGADVVITMLADGVVLDAVYRAAEGVLSALRPGVVAVDMGTSGPEVVGQLVPLVEATGVAPGASWPRSFASG